MSNKVYDVLKWIALIAMPALATLIQTVFSIWGIPYGEPISYTIVALDTFLGICLGVSTSSYNRGLAEGSAKKEGE